jgi:6-phosphofructokinase 1
LKKRIGILTGGGDVPPLNAVIHSVVKAGKSSDIEVVGLVEGWQGLLDKSAVDLNGKAIDPSIGGTILKSSRVNLARVDNAYKRITENISELHLDGLVIIGGEDTLSNAFFLRDVPQVLISKTIDNDVGINEPGRIVNYFTLGYPTAAQKMSSFVSLKEGLRTTAYSHERIMVVESMGMHAGWLAMSSTMGHPDFIVIPEFPLEYEALREKVVERYRRNRNVIVVVSEGARWANGDCISADESDKDDFGHPKFKGAADSLAKRLKVDLSPLLKTKNVNSVNPSYLYRSGRPNELDLKTAVLLGKAAIDLFLNGINEPAFLTLGITNNGFETQEFRLSNLENIEQFHRFVDERYYDLGALCVTPEGKNYLNRIVAEISDDAYGL